MTMDRWNVIEEIFQSALEKPLSERNAYVAHACGDDAELRAEIESLLASAGNATTDLGSLVAGDLREMVRSSEASEIGQRVGPYRLVRELDGGGMGVVYLAVRSDDQYFQFVAVKMIRRGMETPELVQRFRAERQILATLTHPKACGLRHKGPCIWAQGNETQVSGPRHPEGKLVQMWAAVATVFEAA
jgi:eukaryotic-like serine/threonine-protein kinase